MAVPFKIVPEGDGFYTIKDVPIFETHNNRGFNCDEGWMREAIQNFTVDKENGHRPSVIIGHNVKGIEKECEGFLDNLKIVGKRLYADMVRVPKTLKEKIVQNKYPSRSVEVLPTSKRILALALLGGTTPFFSLPQMVYNNDEQSLWYRSPLMLGNQNQNVDVSKIAQDAARAAVEQYSAQLESAQAEEGPEIYELTIPQGAQLLQENPDIQIYQDDEGHCYAEGDDGEIYALPDQLMYRFGIDTAKKVGGYLRGKGQAAADYIGSTRAAGRVSDAGKYVKGKAKRAKDAVANEASGLKWGWGTGKVKGRYNEGIGRTVGAKARQGADYIAANKGRTAAVAGGGAALVGAGAAGGYIAGRNAEDGRRKRRYQIDEDTGTVYFDGYPVGEVALYDQGLGGELPEADTDDPNLVIEPTAVGMETGQGAVLSPGDPSNPHLVPLHREESDQFSDENAMENAELYQLRQQVDQLQQANQLVNLSRRAEQYKAYLLTQKKAGAPVGDINQTVDYMLSQSPEQVKQFMRVLASSPKVQLGSMDAQQYSIDADEQKVKDDFNSNRKQYQALGVDESALKYAQYVRTNRFTNESLNGHASSNGNGDPFTFESES